jgi:hypothetical protein
MARAFRTGVYRDPFPIASARPPLEPGGELENGWCRAGVNGRDGAGAPT